MDTLRFRFRSSLATTLLLITASFAHAQTCGDTDGNGRVDVTDGVVVLKAAAGFASPCTLATCDADGDGQIGVTDGVLVLRAAADLPVLLACPTDDPGPQGCADLKGRWEVWEELEITCRVAGEEESMSAEGGGIIEIDQDGCAIEYWIPGLDLIRTGVVEGDVLRVTGPFALDPLDQLDIHRNEVHGTGRLEGDTLVMTGDGVLEGSVQGWDFRCTGESVAVFTRVGSAAALDEAPLAFTTRDLVPFGGLFGRFAIVGQ